MAFYYRYLVIFFCVCFLYSTHFIKTAHSFAALFIYLLINHYLSINRNIYLKYFACATNTSTIYLGVNFSVPLSTSP